MKIGEYHDIDHAVWGRLASEPPHARLDAQIVDIHDLNPYIGTRFNVVFFAK